MALDPEAGAIGVVFLFPDRHGGFDLVNDGAAGVEGGFAVGGGDGDGDGDVSYLQMPGAVLATGGGDLVISADFFEDALAFFFGKGWEGFIFQRGDIAALVVVTHPALERRVTSGGGITDSITKRAGVDGCFC